MDWRDRILRMKLRMFVFLAVAVVVILPHRRATAQNPALHQVNRIHVAAMGAGAESDRFRGLLEAELQRVGFTVSGSAGEADGILTGDFSAEVHADRSVARVTVLLKSRDGKRTLWSGDFISQHKGEGHEDVVKTLAETCAEQLRKQWQKG